MRASLGLALLVVVAPALAQSPYELAVDVPSVLGGTTYTPHQIVRHESATYAAVVTLPVSVAIGALHRRADGAILFAPSRAALLGGATYEPRDIVSYDGSAYAMHFDGSAAGVPTHARIDAVYVDGSPGTVMSFDVPVQLGGTWRGRSNLERYNGGWSEVWDAAAAGVPASANVVGADRSGSGELVVTFDIPVRIAATLYRPGDLVGWNGTSFHTVASDAAWPASAQLRDFSYLPGAGQVPGTGASLRVNKAAGGSLSLSWGPSCVASDADYEIYEGAIGSGFTSHIPERCTTGGALTTSVTPSSGNRYFLVVPRNGVSEGSYGTGAGGSERTASASACVPRAIAACGSN